MSQPPISSGSALSSSCLQFHLDQALFRAKTRIKEGRAKPIDIAATSLHLTAEFEPEQEPPYQLFEGLSLEDMQELHHDILEFQVRSPQGSCQSCVSICTRPWPALHIQVGQQHVPDISAKEDARPA